MGEKMTKLHLVFDNYGGVSVWRDRRVDQFTREETRWFWIRKPLRWGRR
jgi:hypothetical protein